MREVPLQIRRLLHPHMLRRAAQGPVENAFGELRGWVDCPRLAELKKRAGDPLLTIRCTQDRSLVAGVWQTTAGPLLVTDHDYRPDDGSDHLAALRRLKSSGAPIGRTWAPRLALIDAVEGDACGDVLPLVCSDCRAPRPMTWVGLVHELGVARHSGRRVVLT